MGAGDHDLKIEELGTSKGVDVLRKPTAEEPQPAGTGKKGKEASASEGGEILKMRKEWMAALDLLLPTKPTAKKAQPAGVGKKKKVVKETLPKDFIESIIAKPCKIVQELSDEDLADKPQQFREAYYRARSLNEKVRRYEEALIQQYILKGSAEDEFEVTDDEDEETGEKVTGAEGTSANKVTGD